MPTKKNDGLNKWQRHRLKDLAAYRKRKREYARTEQQREARRKYMKAWRDKNKERYLAWTRTNNAKPENRKKGLIAGSKRNIEKYGISILDFKAMIRAQKGKCAICGGMLVTKGHKRRFHIDHCHTSKKVRGLLCHFCNTKLGWFESNANRIEKYLSR